MCPNVSVLHSPDLTTPAVTIYCENAHQKLKPVFCLIIRPLSFRPHSWRAEEKYLNSHFVAFRSQFNKNNNNNSKHNFLVFHDFILFQSSKIFSETLTVRIKIASMNRFIFNQKGHILYLKKKKKIFLWFTISSGRGDPFF